MTTGITRAHSLAVVDEVLDVVGVCEPAHLFEPEGAGEVMHGGQGLQTVRLKGVQDAVVPGSEGRGGRGWMTAVQWGNNCVDWYP